MLPGKHSECFRESTLGTCQSQYPTLKSPRTYAPSVVSQLALPTPAEAAIRYSAPSGGSFRAALAGINSPRQLPCSCSAPTGFGC
eukprot:3640210-Prymnesium_polylepis.1